MVYIQCEDSVQVMYRVDSVVVSVILLGGGGEPVIKDNEFLLN